MVVDYIGFKNAMLENPVDELKISLALFRNYLALPGELTNNFDARKFFDGTPIERLNCLNAAAEFIQTKKDIETRFMFFLAIKSIIFKHKKGTAPDAEIMNRTVEKMVEAALKCTGIENIVGDEKSVDLFSEDFLRELDAFKMSVTKFNALLKLAKKILPHTVAATKSRLLCSISG